MHEAALRQKNVQINLFLFCLIVPDNVIVLTRFQWDSSVLFTGRAEGTSSGVTSMASAILGRTVKCCSSLALSGGN